MQVGQMLNDLIYPQTKKILFKIEAEKVHETFTKLGEKLGKNKTAKKYLSNLLNFTHPSLNQEIFGINFKNPIGLAAGFDHEGKLTQITPSIGFGFHTIGSITLGSYEGNPKPRLARLPKSSSILVNKGLKNTGTKNIISKLKKLKQEIPIGISVAKTNCKTNSEDNEAIRDYKKSFEIIKKLNAGDYYEINISCPNAFGGEAFTTPNRLNALLKEIDKLNLRKPTFLKMPCDLSTEKTIKLCEITEKHNVQGLIFGNLTKNRENPIFDKDEISKAGKGNFSGSPTKENSNKLIKAVYKKYKSHFIIIGCGGIFSAEDAYEKIKLGASLVQLITGMIYQGPGLISKINRELVELLKKDGFENISEAVGKDNKI